MQLHSAQSITLFIIIKTENTSPSQSNQATKKIKTEKKQHLITIFKGHSSRIDTLKKRKHFADRNAQPRVNGEASE